MTTVETVEVYLSLGYRIPGKIVSEENMVKFCAELRETGEVKSIKYVTSQEVDPGAKGEGIDFNSVMVEIAKAGGVTGVFTAIGEWLGRDNKRVVDMTINGNHIRIEGASKDELKRCEDFYFENASKGKKDGKKDRSAHR